MKVRQNSVNKSVNKYESVYYIITGIYVFKKCYFFKLYFSFLYSFAHFNNTPQLLGNSDKSYNSPSS